MYNYSFTTTYQNIDGEEGDTVYRKEILQAFSLEIYDIIKIGNAIDSLYKDINGEPVIHLIFDEVSNVNPFPFELDNGHKLVLLFSFNYFHAIHNCLRDFYKNKTISRENIENLRKLLKK